MTTPPPQPGAASMTPPEQVCTWTRIDPIDPDGWNASCRRNDVYLSRGPMDAEYAYCPYCGKRLVVSNEV